MSTRYERLVEKYSHFQTESENGKKQMNFMGRGGREKAFGSNSKPKNLRKTVSRLLAYLSKERKLLIIAITSSVIYTAFSLLASYMLRPIINSFIYYDSNAATIEPRLAGLLRGLLLMAVVYGVSVLCQWLQQRLMLTVSQRSLKRMRSDLFSKLQTLPIRYFDAHATGDIMSRFTNDVDTIGEMLNSTLIQIISGSITIVGTVCLMLYTNLILGGITLVLTPVLILISRQIIKHGKAAYRRQQKCLGMLNAFSQETISGQKIVKVFNHEEIAGDEFAYLNQQLCEAQIKAQFRSSIMGPVTHQLCNFSYGLSACVGGILVVLRGFDIGGLTVSLNYTRKFNRPINEISMQMNTVFAALAGAERVFEVLDETPEVPGLKEREIDRLEGSIRMENVNFGYNAETTVLHDISLYAKPGQKIAFVGSTGAGKTTVTNLLSRFYEIQSGNIWIDQIPIDEIPRKFLRQNIAMVLQDTHLFSGTVKENIRYGRLDATDGDVEAAARISCAHSFIMNLENGYDTLLESDGANLSQGQRQLLSIARAAISKAPILILDEATSSVDTLTEKNIQDGMDALMENRTTLVIAHRLSTVRKADAIMVLEKGRIIERGTHRQLLEAGGRYADLYNEIIQLD